MARQVDFYYFLKSISYASTLSFELAGSLYDRCGGHASDLRCLLDILISLAVQ